MPYYDILSLPDMPPETQPLISREISKKEIRIHMLRLDKIHPQISGNKLFKLSKYLIECSHSDHKTVLTFGGPYSNHLAAAAFACRKLSFKVLGLVRGSHHTYLSHTLQNCRDAGMEIHFIDNDLYKNLSENREDDRLTEMFGEHTLIPSGGFGIKGAEGAAEIMDLIPRNTFSHICVSAGSATTLAGLLSAKRNETIIAFPAIKNMNDIPGRVRKMGVHNIDKLMIQNNYHFGGFAKWNENLINFMNHFHEEFQIPLDFIYTAKMMYGVFDMMNQNTFPRGSEILCIHTGGLQGNKSLPVDAIKF